MGRYYSRRQWLKTSALAAAGLVAGTNFPACRPERSNPDQSSGEEKIIRLNSNENPYGISEKARKAIVHAMDQSNRYPDEHYSELKKLIAEKEKISPDHIILGAGSTEVMTMMIYSYGAHREVLAASPTYFDFVDYAEKAGCDLRQVPLNEKFEHDLQAMEKQIGPETGLIYICNPLNPTGTIVPKDRLLYFCEEASRKALVAVDEAYHDYAEDGTYASMLGLVQRGKNIVITRTFSKIYGLAGLRVGYGMAHPDIIKNLEQRQMNFAPIAYPSLLAALASYQDDEFCRFGRERNRFVKSYLYKQMEKQGFSYIPSDANFVLFKVNRDAKETADDFKGHHVLVRPFSFLGGQWIRVSLGTMEEMRAFTSALAEVF